jgi:hypothetical protein
MNEAPGQDQFDATTRRRDAAGNRVLMSQPPSRA